MLIINFIINVVITIHNKKTEDWAYYPSNVSYEI